VTGRREGLGYASRGGRGLHLISYDGPLFEDLKLRREEEGKGGEGELYTQ